MEEREKKFPLAVELAEGGMDGGLAYMTLKGKDVLRVRAAHGYLDSWKGRFSQN